MPTLKYENVLVTEMCCNCGIHFAMPEEFKASRRKDKEYFYCPNGHPQHYTTNEADKLKTQLQALAAERDTIRAERDAAWTNLKQSEAQLKKLKTRTRNGVCEACNRSFGNLQRHMLSKHSELVKAETQD